MCCPCKDRWRNTQAVQGNGLENRQGEQSPLEFESLFLRHYETTVLIRDFYLKSALFYLFLGYFC